jgi:hypothetical protein
MLDYADLLNRLYEARYSGVLRVRHGDRDVTYRSQAELDSAIRDLEIKVNNRRAVYHITPAMRRD